MYHMYPWRREAEGGLTYGGEGDIDETERNLLGSEFGVMQQ